MAHVESGFRREAREARTSFSTSLVDTAGACMARVDIAIALPTRRRCIPNNVQGEHSFLNERTFVPVEDCLNSRNLIFPRAEEDSSHSTEDVEGAGDGLARARSQGSCYA